MHLVQQMTIPEYAKSSASSACPEMGRTRTDMLIECRMSNNLRIHFFWLEVLRMVPEDDTDHLSIKNEGSLPLA
jgi:hypothetical protein